MDVGTQVTAVETFFKAVGGSDSKWKDPGVDVTDNVDAASDITVCLCLYLLPSLPTFPF